MLRSSVAPIGRDTTRLTNFYIPDSAEMLGYILPLTATIESRASCPGGRFPLLS